MDPNIPHGTRQPYPMVVHHQQSGSGSSFIAAASTEYLQPQNPYDLNPSASPHSLAAQMGPFPAGSPEFYGMGGFHPMVPNPYMPSIFPTPFAMPQQQVMPGYVPGATPYHHVHGSSFGSVDAIPATQRDARSTVSSSSASGGAYTTPATTAASSSYPSISTTAGAQPAAAARPATAQAAAFPPVNPSKDSLTTLPAADTRADTAADVSSNKGSDSAFTKAIKMLFGSPKPPAPLPPKRFPLEAAAARLENSVVWVPRKKPNPFKLHFSPVAMLILLAFLASAGYYFYVRVAFTLNMGNHTWYGILILVVELIGLTSVIPYGVLLPFQTLSSGSKGLPIDDGRVILPPEKRFRVHILVPCYKESLEVITNTVTAALAAEVPPGVTRILYLCDDGKSPEKKEFIAGLGDEARYVSGRIRTPGEINGKSANVNNCLRNIIFPEYEGHPELIPLTELVVVFDADMAARRNFLLKILEVMWDDGCSLCLTPQAFSNINPKADIFNNINQQFWEYVLPGCDALGYIACTGTNFCLRARSLGMVGWFPEYTITEDYALSMELKSAGFKGRYLAEYLAVGEAPDEVRNVCRQRSRWTKGHMQIFFSRRCPLTNWKLPLIHKILYTNGTWAYFCTIITTLVFLFVPFNSLVFGYHPVTFSYEFALAATVYLPMNFLLMNYVRKPQHLKGQWMAQVSNHILTFTYMKAVFNTLLSIVGFKEKAGFKATDKSGSNNPIAAIQKLGSNLRNSMQRHNHDLPTVNTPPLAAAAVAASKAASGPMTQRVVIGPDGKPRVLTPKPLTQAQIIQQQLKQQEKQKKKPKRGCWVWINAKTLEGALDPLFLAFSLCLSLAAIAAGVYTVIKSKTFDFSVNSWSDFAQIFTSGRLDVYILVPMLWALYNAIPPLLFFVYFFTKGRLLQGLCSFMQAFGVVLAAAAIASVWLMIPNEYNLKDVLPAVTQFVDTARSGALPPATALKYSFLESSTATSDSIVGGYYMNSDYNKYSLPIATSMTMLAWSLIEFPKGYAAAGQFQTAVDQLKWGADYLMAAHTAPNQFVVQIGRGKDYAIDIPNKNGSWGVPSDMPKNRTAFTINPNSKGGADAAAAAAAALAATYQVYKSTDPSYAQSALSHAQELYGLATMLPTNGTYCVLKDGDFSICAEGIKTGGYRWTAFISNSVYDDLALAAAWLYKATGVRSYASDAEFFFRQHQVTEVPAPMNPTYYIANYDNQAWAAALMIDQLLDFPPAQQQVLDYFKGWMSGSDTNEKPVLFVTPRGLHFLGGSPVAGDEPLPTAGMAAVLAMVYAHNPKSKTRGLADYVIGNMECFALQQVTYALGGQMGKGRSFIVGVGSDYPSKPKQRQASCPTDGSTCNIQNALLASGPNPHVITGAIVAGPDGTDRYADDRTNDQSRVSPAYNIPFMGTIAGLLQYDVKPSQCQMGQGLYQSTFLSFTPTK